MRSLVVLTMLAIATAASAAPRTKVAVMDVKNVQGVPEGTATILTDIVVSEVARFGYEVVSRADIAAIVGFEKEKTLLGCSEDSSCLAEIGGALGVDFMLTGQVGQIGSRFRISLILVEVKKGKVAARAADFCDRNEDALANAAQARVRDIVATMQATAAAERAAADRAAAASAAKAKPAPAPVLTARPPPEPAAAPLIPPPEEPPSASTGGGWSRRKILGVSLVGGGGLVVIGGVVAGLKAKKLDEDLDAASSDIGFYYDYPSKRDKVKRMALTADILYGVGLVTAGVGGYLWIFDKPSAAVTVVPVVGDGQAGVVAMGRF